MNFFTCLRDIVTGTKDVYLERDNGGVQESREIQQKVKSCLCSPPAPLSLV